MKTPRYEVKLRGKWVRCVIAHELDWGCLTYALADGTCGDTAGGDWRKSKPHKMNARAL